MFDHYAGPIAAFMSSITWAAASVAYSRLSGRYSAFAVNLARASVALPLFFIALCFQAGGLVEAFQTLSHVEAKTLGWFMVSMFSSYGLGDALFLMSTRSLGVPGGLAIASCYPMWTALLGYLFRDEVLSLSQIVGMGLTLGGILVVILTPPVPYEAVGSEEDKPTQTHFSAKGVILALLASSCWALNSFSVSQGSREISSVTANTIRMCIAWFMSLGFVLAFARDRGVLLPKREWRSWGWLLAMEAFGGSLFFVYGLSHSPLAIGTTLTSLAPVISVPFSLLFKLERFSVVRTLGLVMSVIGLSLLVGK